MDAKEASVFLTKTFSRGLLEFGNIMSFRRIARLGLPYAKESLEKWYEKFVEDLLTKPEYEGMIKDPDAFLQKGFAGQLPGQMALGAVTTFESKIDSASLVFGHSVLDNIAFQYCRLSVDVAPEDWSGKVENQKVELRSLANMTYDEIGSSTLRV